MLSSKCETKFQNQNHFIKETNKVKIHEIGLRPKFQAKKERMRGRTDRQMDE